MRLTFVQYGDFREAFHRLEAGGEETYMSQRYTVDYVVKLASHVDDLSVICLNAPNYNEVLPNGIRTFGMKLWKEVSPAQLTRFVAQQQPTHMVLRTPLSQLLRWALRNDVRTLPLVADSFLATSLKRRVRNWMLVRALNNPAVPYVANHNVVPSQDLARIGVRPDKIIPWDFPPVNHPRDFPVKERPASPDALRLVYIGPMVEAKGVGDCIEAAKRLMDDGIDVTLTATGDGDDLPAFQALAKRLGIEDAVQFPGRVSYSEVTKQMRINDVAIVSSRHNYPDGIPLCIYDAFCARTPLVASDHPMYRGKIIDGENALVFEAGNAQHMAERIKELVTRPNLYAQLSTNSIQAWERLQCPVKWHELLDRWLRNSDEDRQWLDQYTLANGNYA